MFSGYNLTLSSSFFDNCNGIDINTDRLNNFNYYRQIGENNLNGIFKTYFRDLEDYINNDIINGTDLESDCFPQIEADVFISHSHNDKDLANAFAGWLNEIFDLRVFVDSNVWDYSYNILEAINEKYSKKRKNPYGKGYLYNHKRSIYASQHVDMMLSVALQKMIDKTECIIFLNTENSIPVFETEKSEFCKTYSPWIYSEILCTQIVRKKPLLFYRNYPTAVFESAIPDRMEYLSEMFMVVYNVPLEHLTDLSEDELYHWKKVWNSVNKDSNEKYSLDYLYTITRYAYDVKKTKSIFKNYSLNQIERLKRYIKRGNINAFCNTFGHEFKCEGCKCEKCPFYEHSGNLYIRG